MKCLPDVIDDYCRDCQRLSDTASEGVIHMIGSFDNACAYLPKSAPCKEVQSQSAHGENNEHQ